MEGRDALLSNMKKNKQISSLKTANINPWFDGWKEGLRYSFQNRYKDSIFPVQALEDSDWVIKTDHV